jgi:hypothetical protein
MWIVAILSDGPLRGHQLEIDVLNSGPPKMLDLDHSDGERYTYTLGRASSRARRWSYCYLSRDGLAEAVPAARQ